MISSTSIKKIVLIVIMTSLAQLLSCCNGRQSTVIQNAEAGDETNIPIGWASGKGEEFVPITKAEQNLVAQHDTYQSALFLGNVDEMKHFFYRESLEYYKKYFPEYSLNEILDEFLGNMSSDAMKMIREYENNGITFSLYIEKIIRKVEYGNDLLYVYNVCSRMEGYKNDTIAYLHTTEPDMTLGVSHNKGRNWTFISMTNDVPSILRMYYPQNVVDDVMGY